MEKFNLNAESRVLVVGAGHGIGLALTKELRQKYGVKHVWATYRDESRASELLAFEDVTSSRLDPIVEEEVKHFFSNLKTSHLDAIFISVGALKFDGLGPEKSLKDFNLDFAMKNFMINSFVAPQIFKHALPKIDRQQRSILAVLSAKVGSLEDNALGGWYSYRASKAALNMYLKTLSIELIRSRYTCQVFALHPGTVLTQLSQDYVKSVQHEVFSPDQAATLLLEQVQGWDQVQSARFLAYDGTLIPW